MLQASSVKIAKSRRRVNPQDLNFICGGCNSAYRSYPALYLHIKRKHNGIRPPNTKSSKLLSSIASAKTHTGRPQKPPLDVDNIAESQILCEQAQSELLGFLGEKLAIVTLVDSKPKLQNVVFEILEASKESSDGSLAELRRQTQELFEELKQEENEAGEIDLDFDTFGQLDKSNSLRILCWFLLWLGKYIVKLEVLKELVIVFSKIWGVMKQKQIEIQDLDNKLVWNGVVKELEPFFGKLNSFNQKKELVYEFVSKTCHLIGKIFE